MGSRLGRRVVHFANLPIKLLMPSSFSNITEIALKTIPSASKMSTAPTSTPSHRQSAHYVICTGKKAGKVEQLQYEVAELQNILASKQQQEANMLKILMRMTQQKKVTEDARLAAELEASNERCVAHLLQFLEDKPSLYSLFVHSLNYIQPLHCIYYVHELAKLKKSVNDEADELRSEFQDLRTTLLQQQDDVTDGLKNLGDTSKEPPIPLNKDVKEGSSKDYGVRANEEDDKAECW